MIFVKFEDVREGDIIDVLAENETLAFEVIFKDEEIVQLRCEDFHKGGVSHVIMNEKEFDDGGFTRKRRRSSIQWIVLIMILFVLCYDFVDLLILITHFSPYNFNLSLNLILTENIMY